MSKIALTGNASGSGTFTLAAPNSDTDRVLTLPDGAGTLSFGVTQADIWRLTADKTGSSDITANLERADNTSSGIVGTGMTESSGIFSFPETGVYLVRFNGRFDIDTGDSVCQVQIQVTTNNSSYEEVALATTGSSANVFGFASAEALVDVTDISNVKVKFTTQNFSTNTGLSAGTTTNRTHFVFIRLGDT